MDIEQDNGPRFPSVVARLEGRDNIFDVIQAVRVAMRRARIADDRIVRFTKQASAQNHMDDVVHVCMQWVTVE